MSSVFFTNSIRNNGTLTWKKKEMEINSLLKAVGINSSTHIQPTDLLKEAGNYSTIIPTLTKAFATQVAKQIFNGKLYEKTKYETGIGKLYPKLLHSQKKKIEHQITNLSKNKKRVKQQWTHDEKKYLDGLKDYVLSRIDEKNIQDYFTTNSNSHLFKGKKINSAVSKTSNQKNFSDSFTPLLGFLIGVWIENHKAGYYVHRVVPYATRFSEITKEFYNKKYKDIKLPEKPDYFFPDYEESPDNLFKKYIDEWLKGRKTYEHWYSLFPVDRSSEIKSITKIEWISPTNNTHKNIALRYLSDNSQQASSKKDNSRKYLSSLWKAISPIFLRHKKHNCNLTSQLESTNDKPMQSFSEFWGGSKHNPLSLFCINEAGKSQPDFMLFQPDQTSYTTENITSSKIIFYRDDKGFNLLYPINKQLIEKDTQDQSNHEEQPVITENLINKYNDFLSEFKKYISENFPFLILKYHSFIKKNNNNNSACCCNEIINTLVEFIELSHKLRDWNLIWKFYDIRKINNSALTASSTRRNNYLSKMGTGDINPPEFLKSRIEKDLPKLKELSKTIKEYISKVSKYLTNNQKHIKQPFQLEKQSNKDGHNYWVIKIDNKNDDNCMKDKVLQYLLESIFTQKLINKFLKIPLLFESSHNLLTNNSSQSNTLEIKQASQNINESWIERLVNEKWKTFFNKDDKNNKLYSLLLEKIKKELILSRISDISDTTLHYLTKTSESSEKKERSNSSELNKWDNIESFINLTNLDDNSNDQLNEQLKTFITSLYLIENSFEEYREHIRKIIKSEGFGVYAFTLSWNKFCTVDDFLLDPIQKVELDSFWTPLNSESEKKDSKEWDSNFTDPKKCINTYDRLSTSSLKKRHSNTSTAKLLLNFLISIWEGISTSRSLKEETLMGFKGLISAENLKKLPEDFYLKILSLLYKKGHINWSDIESQIRNFKTNNQLIQYVKRIEHINSSIKTTFEFSDVTKRPKTTDEAKTVDTMDWFNLQKRKELVIQFIKSNLLTTQPLTQKRFQGLFFEKNSNDLKKKYVFDKNENSSIAYLIQITTDDLKDNDSFFNFIQDHLTPESLIHDVVKQSQNKALQMKAINHFLSRGTWINNKKVFNLRSGDYFLKDQFSSIVTV